MSWQTWRTELAMAALAAASSRRRWVAADRLAAYREEHVASWLTAAPRMLPVVAAPARAA